MTGGGNSNEDQTLANQQTNIDESTVKEPLDLVRLSLDERVYVKLEAIRIEREPHRTINFKHVVRRG